MIRRVLFYEKVIDITEEELESYEKAGIPIKDKDFDTIYRRTYIPLDSIFRAIEIVDSKTDSILEFTDGEQIIIKGSFEAVCKKLDKLNNPDAE